MLRVFGHSFRIFALLCASCFQLSAQDAEGDSGVRVVGDAWCPYSCEDGDGPAGLLVDLTRKVMERAGRGVNYMVLPWHRALRGASLGDYDIILAVSAAGREDSLLLSNAWMRDTTGLLVHKSFTGQINRIEDLAKYRIGSIAEYLYDAGGPWDTAIQTHPDRLTLYSDQGDAFLVELLTRDRFEVAVINRDVASHQLVKLGMRDEYKFIGPEIGGKLVLGFTDSERGRELKSIFDTELAGLCKTGWVEELIATYQVMPGHLETLCPSD